MSSLKQRILSCLVLLAVFWTANVSAEDKPNTSGPSSVWEVELGGNRIYLAGTIHLLRDKDYPLPDVFNEAYKNSAKLVFELPPGSEGNGEVVQRMRKLGAYPDNDDLSAHLTPDAYQRILAWADKNDFPAATLKRFRPWFLALTVAAVEYSHLGATPDHGLDNYFEKRAKDDDKAGAGLESVEFQLTLFTSLPEKLQEQLLVQTLDEVDTMPKDFDELLSSWRRGDAEVLYKFLFKDADKFPELMEKFLTKRNKAWVPAIEKYLKSGEHIMVLVGAGHLVGKSGLIELLKEKGCTVRQLGK